MKFDQDLCLNLQYDFGKMNSTLGSVVPLAMFYSNLSVGAGNNVDEAMSSSKKVLQTIHSVLLLYSCL